MQHSAQPDISDWPLAADNMQTSGEVTRLLQDWSDGRREALDQLLPLVYDELRRLAHSYLTRERSGHTLQTTALVHEAYLKLIDQRSVNWQNHGQFFAISAQAMRRILIDSARRRTSGKRGSGGPKVSLDEAATISAETARRITTGSRSRFAGIGEN